MFFSFLIHGVYKEQQGILLPSDIWLTMVGEEARAKTIAKKEKTEGESMVKFV